MLLTRGVRNTLSLLLVFDAWERKLCIWENLTCVLHISHHFSTLNNWYLHLLVYYKYMLNFQWGLFCRLYFEVTFFKLLHFKLDTNFLFTWSSCVIPRLFWNILLTFLQIFHMSLHNLILCKSKIYYVFNSLYVHYHNLNLSCIETNIFYNGFWKHGGEVALVWTWPSSWIARIKNCSSNTSKMGLLVMKICWGKLSFNTLGCNKALTLLRLHSSPQLKCMIS